MPACLAGVWVTITSSSVHLHFLKGELWDLEYFVSFIRLFFQLLLWCQNVSTDKDKLFCLDVLWWGMRQNAWGLCVNLHLSTVAWDLSSQVLPWHCASFKWVLITFIGSMLNSSVFIFRRWKAYSSNFQSLTLPFVSGCSDWPQFGVEANDIQKIASLSTVGPCLTDGFSTWPLFYPRIQ